MGDSENQDPVKENRMDHHFDNPAFSENNDVTHANGVTVTFSTLDLPPPDNEMLGNMRARTISSTNSVNYDDIISAQKMIDEDVIEPTPQKSNPGNNRRVSHQHRRISYPSNKRRSSNFGRRMSGHEVIDEEDLDEFCHRELILKIRKTLPLKNFKDEIRARKDLEKFLVKPVVLLDVPHTSLDMIIDDILKKLQKDLDVDESITAQAGKAFFTFQEQWEEEPHAFVDHLKETIQGVKYKSYGADYEETWITTLCTLPMLKKSHVGIARLRNPLNLGNKCEEIKFVLAVIAPKREKYTKSAVEIGRTFSSIMCSSSFRLKLLEASTEDDFKDVLTLESIKYKNQMKDSFRDKVDTEEAELELEDYTWKDFGRGIIDDLKRRLPFYWSDYKDGVMGKNTIHKLIATIFFLYFSILLPDIAFGTLYEKITDGKIDVISCILSQTIGGLIFSLMAGQPMLVLVTTAPLALYVKGIQTISETFNFDFLAMYTMIGIWNGIFLILQAFFNVSKYMKYSSRSTEEIFGVFISIAFAADAIKATIINFEKNFHFEMPEVLTVAPNISSTTISNINATTASDYTYEMGCIDKYTCFRPENSILFLFLMFGTLWLGITLLKFDDSQFLSPTKREIFKDYSLPLTVIVFSFIGSYGFRSVKLEPFQYDLTRNLFAIPAIHLLPLAAHLAAVGLGLCLSLLFFVDQNVSAALISSPQYKLKKGPAYHWDLLVVGALNIFMSLFNLPWVHAALPHSPLHVKALADVEQHVSNIGTVTDEIVKVRETRLTSLIAHIFIGLSLLIVHILQLIPVAVLQGLFLFIGLSSFAEHQMYDRMLLIFTEGSSYPPNHYVRKVPQRKIHLFTLLQILQLTVVCVFGFAEQYYLKMIFPIIIILLIPIRYKILPLLIENRYLSIVDS